MSEPVLDWNKIVHMNVLTSDKHNARNVTATANDKVTVNSKVWSYKDSRFVVRITGSHQHSRLFGAISLDGRQLFRQYHHFNEDALYEFLKQIHRKFPRCYLFLDKAPQHYRSSKIRKYFEGHNDSLTPIYLPTASLEFMVLEECWNKSKDDLLVLTYHKSFTEFRMKIGQYFRTKHFNLNMYPFTYLPTCPVITPEENIYARPTMAKRTTINKIKPNSPIFSAL